MAAERRAEVTWNGSLFEGGGSVSLVSSGVMTDQGVTWAARTERSDGKTSPEELIAGAHAACFSMALSNMLAQAGSPPEQLDVGATCTFDKTDAGMRITTMRLEVRGRVPGIDAATFEEKANAAKDGCPVSNALAGNVDISVDAKLEG